MNDTDIRDMLRQRADGVATEDAPPASLARRIRRRQARNMAATGLGVVAVIGLAVVGLRAIFPAGDGLGTPSGESGIVTGLRLASLPDLQVQVPAGWDLWLVPTIKWDEDPANDIPAQRVLANFTMGSSFEFGVTPTGCGEEAGSAERTPEGGMSIVIGTGEAPFPRNGNAVIGGKPVLEPSALNCARQYTATWIHEADSTVGRVIAPAWAVVTIGPNGPGVEQAQAVLDSIRYSGYEPAPASGHEVGAWIADSPGAGGWTLTANASEVTLATDTGSSYVYSPSAGDLGPPTVDSPDARLLGIAPADATTVALERPDGSAIPGLLFAVPEGLWDAEGLPFVIEGYDPSGTVVARDDEGEVVAQVSVQQMVRTRQDKAAQSLLRNALAAAKTLFTDHDTYGAWITAERMAEIERALDFDESSTASVGIVSVRSLNDEQIVLATRSASGTVFCLADDVRVGTSYDTVDAQTVAECNMDSWEPDAKPVEIASPEPTPSSPERDAKWAQSDLRNAWVVAKVHFTDQDTYAGLTPEIAASIEPALAFNASGTVVEGEVSIREVTDRTVLLVTRRGEQVRCIADSPPPRNTTYGRVDAQTAEGCAGGWYPPEVVLTNLQQALTAARRFYAREGSFDDFRASTAREALPKIAWVPASDDPYGEDVAIQAAEGSRLMLWGRSDAGGDGTFCVAVDESTGDTSALTTMDEPKAFEDCWYDTNPRSTPAPSPAP